MRSRPSSRRMKRARWQPGMVISVELPYYLLGVGSFQLERMVQVGASGAEVLDRLPFELDPTRGSEGAAGTG